MSHTSIVRRTGLAGLATGLVLGAGFVTAGSASAAAGFDLDRLEGANRYETSAAAAREFGAANTVILASGEDRRYPDALTANYLAGLRNAPILLTSKNQTPDEIKAAITETGAKNVLIVGGTDVISKAQQADLDGWFDNVRRIAGDDRYATAAKVIAEGDEASGDVALLATGLNFPDALGGGPLAFAQKMPLAITRPDDAPDNVVTELKKAGITKVLVLGGKDAVSDAVIDELNGKGIMVEKRFEGADRAETSALFAEYLLTQYGFSQTAVNVASGYSEGDGADALSGAPLTGQEKRALLITKSRTDAGDGVMDFLAAHDTFGEGTIFGGEAALAESAEIAMEKAVLGSGARNGASGAYFPTVDAAIAAAKSGQTIEVFGTTDGFTVDKADVTIKGDAGANITGAIVVQGVDGTTVQGLSVTPSDVGGQVAGVYLNNAEKVTIIGNTFTGGDDKAAGVINEAGGEKEVAMISRNSFIDLHQGVYANPTAEFTIDSNTFRNNTAGSANDAASVITDNTFLNNDEGVGLSVFGSTVTDNVFTNNVHHVGDYTSGSEYDLAALIAVNSFDEDVVVSGEDTDNAAEYIQDEN